MTLYTNGKIIATPLGWVSIGDLATDPYDPVFNHCVAEGYLE